MKQILFITIALLCCSASFGQTKKDSVVVNYIESKNQYLDVSDTSNLLPSIKPYYNLIVDYFAALEIDANYYYILKSSIKYENNTLVFSLFHYDGFVKLQDGQEIVGNTGGKDGNLKINTKNKTVISFLGYK